MNRQFWTRGNGRKKTTMIKLVVIGVTFMIPFFGLSQYDGKGEDEASRFRPGSMWFFTGLRPAKESKARKYDRLIFDLTYNDWIGDRDLFQNHWASIGFNTNLMFDIPLTKGNTVSFGIGVSHQWVNIRHDNHLRRTISDESTNYEMKDPLDSFDKSKYGSHSFGVPIELRFRNESWRHFKFHMGGRIGYKVQAYSKYSGINLQGSDKYENKTMGYYDDTPLVYSAHIRLGLRNWGIFGSYSFNKMFSKTESTQLNLLQFGLSISLF